MCSIMLNIVLWTVVGIVGLTNGLPSGYYESPQRSVMFGGYYSNPLFGRSHSYIPQGAMSAFVTRDAVATNTFAGNPPIIELPLDQKETFEEEHVSNRDTEVVKAPSPPVAVEEVSGVAEEVSTESLVVTEIPKRVGRKKVIKKPVVVEEDEEEEEVVPSRRTNPGTNIYFPISISGPNGGARRRSGSTQQEDDYYFPGSATAIANSYSTGKGGIATSHATSFGDPYMASMLFRSGMFNFNKSKKGQEIEA